MAIGGGIKVNKSLQRPLKRSKHKILSGSNNMTLPGRVGFPRQHNLMVATAKKGKGKKGRKKSKGY